MRTLGHVMCTAALAIALAGCGSDTGPGDVADTTGGADSASAQWHGCTADDVLDARAVAELDLDGDGRTEAVRAVAPGADQSCAGSLVADLGPSIVGMALGDRALDLDSAQVIQLEGTDRQLLLLRAQAHPRGGFQLHLLGTGTGADGLGEITTAGNPVVPFVATDGGAAPATATCTDDGGIATVTATTAEPPGVILAWDVWRTTYGLQGNTATKTSSGRIEEDAADPLLRKQMPQLFDPEGYFADCLVDEAKGQ